MHRLAPILIGLLLSQTVPAGGQPAPDSTNVNVNIQFYGSVQQGGPSPFELVKGGILFKAKVAGQDVWALLDNLSERSLIEIDLARAAGLDIAAPNGTVNTPLGILPKQRVSDVPIIIPGQLEMRTPAIGGADLKPLSARYGRPIGLVLGQEYCANLTIFVDFAAGQFGLRPSGSMNGGPQFIPLQNDKPQLETIVGGKAVVATLDLGFDGPLRLSPQAWARLRLEGARPEPAPPSGQPDRPAITRVSVVIGTIKANDAVVEIAPLAPEDGDAMLGFGAFRRTAIILDINMGRLWIRPIAAANPQ